MVAADTAGAPGSVSPVPALVGLNEPDEIDAVGIPVAALSAKVRVTVGGSVGAGWPADVAHQHDVLAGRADEEDVEVDAGGVREAGELDGDLRGERAGAADGDV